MNDIVKTDDDLSTITIDTLKKWGSDSYLDIYFNENFRYGETNFVKLGIKLILDEKYKYFFLFVRIYTTIIFLKKENTAYLNNILYSYVKY